MPGTTSRPNHRRVPDSNVSLRYSDGVKILLWPHLKCLSGDGHHPGSCSRRKQLLELAINKDWPWVNNTSRWRAD